ncbi:phage portal protein, partial [Nonomuraea sp. NPDC049400]|uniref:phage portal protein n=1 Tax=Nonomuraea sp. NPDC049400 TaxID=3364352 RepID=UPI00378A4272
AHWRGMSWLTPVLREISSDLAATRHKWKFFENGATPGLAITFDKTVKPETIQKLMATMEYGHEGVDNAYRTLYLGGGADVTPLTMDLQQLDFKRTQGAGETRLAAAAGVPASIVGFTEGLAGSSLNAGNYGQARRRFADGTLRPLWRNCAGSLASLVDVPEDAELWYDDRDIAFLREDRKDAAEIFRIKSATVSSFITAGFKPDSVKAAVEAEDLALLEHTGLVSVQLLPPGLTRDAPAAAPSTASSSDDPSGPDPAEEQ